MTTQAIGLGNEVSASAPEAAAPAVAPAVPSGTPEPTPVAPPQGSETAPQASPEPQATPVADPPAPSFDPSILETLGEEDLRKIPAIERLLSQETATLSQKAEEQQAQQLAQQRDRWYQNQGYIRNIEALIAKATDADGAVDLNALGMVVDNMWVASSAEAQRTIDGILQQRLPADVTFTRQEMDQLERVRNEVYMGTKPLDALIGARWDLSVKAYADKVLKPQIREEMRREAAASAQTDTLKQTAEQRQQAPSPTTGVYSTAGSETFRTQAEMRAAHAEGRITNAQMRQWKADGTLARLPLA